MDAPDRVSKRGVVGEIKALMVEHGIYFQEPANTNTGEQARPFTDEETRKRLMGLLRVDNPNPNSIQAQPTQNAQPPPAVNAAAAGNNGNPGDQVAASINETLTDGQFQATITLPTSRNGAGTGTSAPSDAAPAPAPPSSSFSLAEVYPPAAAPTQFFQTEECKEIFDRVCADLQDAVCSCLSRHKDRSMGLVRINDSPFHIDPNGKHFIMECDRTAAQFNHYELLTAHYDSMMRLHRKIEEFVTQTGGDSALVAATLYISMKGAPDVMPMIVRRGERVLHSFVQLNEAPKILLQDDTAQSPLLSAPSTPDKIEENIDGVCKWVHDNLIPGWITLRKSGHIDFSRVDFGNNFENHQQTEAIVWKCLGNLISNAMLEGRYANDLQGNAHLLLAGESFSVDTNDDDDNGEPGDLTVIDDRTVEMLTGVPFSEADTGDENGLEVGRVALMIMTTTNTSDSSQDPQLWTKPDMLVLLTKHLLSSNPTPLMREVWGRIFVYYWMHSQFCDGGELRAMDFTNTNPNITKYLELFKTLHPAYQDIADEGTDVFDFFKHWG